MTIAARLLVTALILLLVGCDTSSPQDADEHQDPEVPESTPDFSGRWLGIAVSEMDPPTDAVLQLIASRDSSDLYEAMFDLDGGSNEVFGEAEYYPEDRVLILYELIPGTGRRTRAVLSLVEGAFDQLNGESTGSTISRRIVLEDLSRDDNGPTPPSIDSVFVRNERVIVAFDQPVELLIQSTQLFDVADGSQSRDVARVTVEGNMVELQLREPLTRFPRRSYTVAATGIIGESGLSLIEESAMFDHGASGDANVVVSGDYSDSFQGGGSFYAADEAMEVLSIGACDEPPSIQRCVVLQFEGVNPPQNGEYAIGASESGDELFALFFDFSGGNTVAVASISGSLSITQSQGEELHGTFEFKGQLFEGTDAGSAHVEGSFEAVYTEDGFHIPSAKLANTPFRAP